MAGQEEIQSPQAIAPQADIPAVEPAEERAADSRHDPLRHSPYYYKSFWGSYKGMAKGIMGGLLIGALVGGAIGGLLYFGLPLFVAGGTLTTSLFASSVLVCSALGMMKGMHAFEEVGAVAGATAATAEVLEHRILDGVSQIVSKGTGRYVPPPATAETEKASPPADNAHQTARPHFFSSTDPNKKFFHFDVGLTGLAIGALAGGLLFAGINPLLAIPFIKAEVGILSAVTLPGAMALCGAYGASYGIDRNLFRRAFDFSDKLFLGRFFPHKEKSFSQDHQVGVRLPENYLPAQPTVTPEEAALVSQLQRGPQQDPNWQARLAAAQKEFQNLDPSNTRVH